jgi:hypothetical protein
MSNDGAQIRRTAAEHVQALGPEAVDWLEEQAEIAESIGDHEAAETWREIATVAKSLTGRTYP